MYHNTAKKIRPVDPFVEFRFEPSDILNSNEKLMIELFECLELLEIDFPGAIFVFFAL